MISTELDSLIRRGWPLTNFPIRPPESSHAPWIQKRALDGFLHLSRRICICSLISYLLPEASLSSSFPRNETWCLSSSNFSLQWHTFCCLGVASLGATLLLSTIIDTLPWKIIAGTPVFLWADDGHYLFRVGKVQLPCSCDAIDRGGLRWRM